jgi:hypothetical protein
MRAIPPIARDYRTSSPADAGPGSGSGGRPVGRNMDEVALNTG